MSRFLRCAVALLLVVTGLAGCEARGPRPDLAAQPATIDSFPVPPPALPDPPPPVVPEGTAEERAVLLADAFEVRNSQRAAALLGAFTLAGIPVVNGTEHSITTPHDTVGVPWAQLWTAATAADPRARVQLSEIMTFFTADGTDGLDPAAAGDLLLCSLRNALTKGSGEVRQVALLVREESRRAGRPDLVDPAVTAADVTITVPTAVLLVSAGTLTSLAVAPLPPAGRSAGPTGVRRLAAALQNPPGGCAEDDAGQWAIWIVSKLAAGVGIPGVAEWRGPFQTLLDHLSSHYRNAGLVEDVIALRDNFGTVSTVAGYATGNLTILSLFVAMATHTGKAELLGGGPLVRTKSSRRNGETVRVVVTVSYDYGDLDPEVVKGLNCLLALLGVVAGNNTTMPNPGAAGGVAVSIQGRRGFADRLIEKDALVLFDCGTTEIDPQDTCPPATERVAGDDGTASFPVSGRMQRFELSDRAHPVEKEFSVNVEATADPRNGSTVVKTFLDSILCGGVFLGASPLTCADAIVDVLKQFDWDLGEWTFDLTDWSEARLRYRATASLDRSYPYSEPTRNGTVTQHVLVSGSGEVQLQPFRGDGTMAGEGDIAYTKAEAEFTDVGGGIALGGAWCEGRLADQLTGTTAGWIRAEPFYFTDDANGLPFPESLTVELGGLSETMTGQYVNTAGPCPSGEPSTSEDHHFLGAYQDAHHTVGLGTRVEITGWQRVDPPSNGVFARATMRVTTGAGVTFDEVFEVVR
ncbi:hypothetical protein ACQPZX_20930 [Actinoplanes sp. CA-142083]|uniref:hypothetical protein n=1 Tax=Actinoplanes sp. CA-142083 TaxID=3239903 RepID=UPI003D9503A0